jgi:anti-sigma factor RsiW
MDHAEARELLELAAVEPHGFERLMAGDTSDAAALAGHLAGCDDCADEMARLRRAAGVIREVVRTTPPPDLRERTLAFVRDVGRDRRAPALEPALAGTPTAERPTAELPRIQPVVEGAPTSSGSRGRFGRPAWLGAIAATLVLSVGATAFVVRTQADDQARRQAVVVEQLGKVTSWYIEIEAQPDAQRVALTSPNAAGATGTIEYSPTTGRLVVVATGLTEPTGSQPLGCWIEVDGARRPIGRMIFGAGLSYWAGSVEQPETLRPGAKFGVSSPDGDTLLVGEL